MANYQNLKNSIAQVIKTNGNQEITGQLLQNTLNSIVTTIGAGYTFAGVATPSTNPGTPDQNIFYLAPSGTYPNFKGTVIDYGDIGIFKYNGNWIIERLDISKTLSAKLDSINFYTEIKKIKNGYFNDSGIFTSASLDIQHTDLIDVKPGMVFVYSARSASSVPTEFYYKDDVLVKKEKSGTVVKDKKITIPEGVNKIRFQSYLNDLIIDTEPKSIKIVAYDNAKKIKNLETLSSNTNSLKILFIGNSINQDHVTYLPWMLKSIYGDTIDFDIAIFYIGGYSIKDYVDNVIDGTTKAHLFSRAINTESWTTEGGSVTLEAAIKKSKWDLISVQGYFFRDSEDLSLMPTLVKFIEDKALSSFRLGYMMHQAYSKEVLKKTIDGAKKAIRENPVQVFFPCGFATEYAKKFLSNSVLTADNLHNQEGLPCAIGDYTVLAILSEFYNLKKPILKDSNILTEEKHKSLNIPGQNGSFQAGTADEWVKGQEAALKAVNAGKGLMAQTFIEEINQMTQL